MRGVLDTNVLVAGMAYPSGPPGRIVAAWRRGALQVVLSPWILTECERVLPRLRPYHDFSAVEIRELLDCMMFEVDLVEPDLAALAQAADARLRDAADEPVLATLLTAAAEVLVSGDRDLLALADRYPILTPAEFCTRFAP
ncbi:MAG: putative toxin-antitoxin system toxin component, PIN family [Xanthomonadales bacterium]|jgi:putative PIN family toxin of toxin-antitoxin system|nr:putative toxin-antitoxin system toxin component, PIN family [Xanthomonadales bacterium]